MDWVRELIGQLPQGISPSDTFTEQWLVQPDGDSVGTYFAGNGPAIGIGKGKEWRTRTVTKIDVPKDRALAWLAIKLNQHEDDPDSFIDYTAKELAIKMAFDMEETDATAFFKKLEEPLASRVLHYLIKLGVQKYER